MLMDLSALRELGLSEREAKVYVALSSTGPTTVWKLVSKTRLASSKVYESLNKLVDRGLVSYVFSSGKRIFQACPPSQLLQVLSEKHERLEELVETLEKGKVPQQNNSAFIYQGFPAVKRMYARLLGELDAGDYYFVFAFREQYRFSEQAKLFLRRVHAELGKKKIDDRILASPQFKRELESTYRGIKNLKIRYSRKEIPLGLVISKNRVINQLWGEQPMAFEIYSPALCEQYKKFFLENWNAVK